MNKKILPGILAFALLLAGCGSDVVTASPPAFITATLAPINTPQPPASTQIPPSLTVESSPVQPVEGVTTTQLNLRSEPSTAGESLGTVAAFSTVQIIGREVNGAWYQVLHTASSEGKGWITANYVQVNSINEIPVIDLGPSGLILQGVNVRNGPGKDFPSLGTLVQNDVIRVTGKDSNGAWVQVSFKGAPGWIASEFIKVKNPENLAVVESRNEETPIPLPGNPANIPPAAAQDTDSLEAPIASVNLGSAGVRRLQSDGYVSPASDDEADWVQFTAVTGIVAIELQCAANGLKLDLYQNGSVLRESFLVCNETKTLNATSGQTYTLKLTANAATQPNTPYSVFVNIVR